MWHLIILTAAAKYNCKIKLKIFYPNNNKKHIFTFNKRACIDCTSSHTSTNMLKISNIFTLTKPQILIFFVFEKPHIHITTRCLTVCTVCTTQQQAYSQTEQSRHQISIKQTGPLFCGQWLVKNAENKSMLLLVFFLYYFIFLYT